jgi:hypothetical protein
MNQSISESETRQAYKNKIFCQTTQTLDKRNNKCVVFHTEQGHIQSDTVYNLGDME